MLLGSVPNTNHIQKYKEKLRWFVVLQPQQPNYGVDLANCQLFFLKITKKITGGVFLGLTDCEIVVILAVSSRRVNPHIPLQGLIAGLLARLPNKTAGNLTRVPFFIAQK